MSAVYPSSYVCSDLQLGAHSLFDHSIERLTDVKRLYNLCDHVQATAELRANWAAYIKVAVSMTSL